MTAEPPAVQDEQALSLFHVTRQIFQLQDLANDPEITEEERAIARQEIERYLRCEVRKVDNIRGYLRHCEVMEAAAAEESRRQSAMAREWAARAGQVKSYCASVMQEFGEKKLVGKTGQLVCKGNGGLQALTIEDPQAIPEQYFIALIQMPLPLWKQVRQACEWQEINLDGTTLKTEVDMKAVREDMPVSGARLEPRGQHIEVR